MKKLINQIEKNTKEFQKKISKKNRKSKSQFFTTLSIAKYMSNLSCKYNDKDNLNILDCGAGTGILAFSLVDKLIEEGFKGTLNIDLYENDEVVIDVLLKNIDIYKAKYKNLNIKVFQSNFILENMKLWEDKSFKGKYDIVISNPPYKKLKKSSDEAMAMKSIVYGQPNIYFLFMAMSIHLLKNNGEMLFITPRSFTSGTYFKVFRSYFLDNTCIRNVHIFDSRSDVFDGEEVLQEAIITRTIKNNNKNNELVNISISKGADFEDIKSIKVYSDDLITNCNNRFILLPSSNEEVKILSKLSKYKNNLINLGFKLRTGKVVDFRAIEYLTKKEEKEAVPLFWPDNFINNKIVNVENYNNYRYILNKESSKNILQENKDYILIKRFSSKEENRRIQAAIYNKSEFNRFDKIGIENHINFIEKINGVMTKEEQYGLFCIFNSTIIDKYYRILNGNTQVNATEFNSIPLPEGDIIINLGKELLNLGDLETEACDLIISKYI
ncbi:Eco57I restriction-modification methylase domain-containing protein (plasmid) [Clostridium perfringens]|uniref:site-specific DNA-methyltransferase (adenine-specific) n=1 Tax=Clostridium perfringens TaxID=1502 RepID=X5I2A9_CLOPF|nr:Eco57I restriction-modification methylase domain-containing protein [Clostridium perfringens]EHK2364653.1 Eco57I restriction-modification methylase domain-containing protein [Clostridium perfringens]SQC85657.1 DNA modification methyltransferase [Clostridium perfringens]BAO58346.1 modification methylase BusBI [Clostridium perfringens]BAO58401.1 modification methylase BusBI [Clostridium perfringens]BDA23676.1 Eco571 restriction-modification methylase domain-containing protein [Clostridium per